MKRDSNKAREQINNTKVQKYIQEITDKIFDTCGSMSKVQYNLPEITKDEAQSAIKTLLAHKCYDPASLKNEAFKSGGDLFLNSITKMLNFILKEKQPPEQWKEVIIQTLYKWFKEGIYLFKENNYCGIF